MEAPLKAMPESAGSWAQLRDFLKRSGYTEEAVCQRLGLSAQHAVLSQGFQQASAEVRDTLDLLTRLFLEGSSVEESLVSRILPAPVVSLLKDLGLLAADPVRPGALFATASLYPVRRLYVASDRWSKPDGSHFVPQPDIVYPAITKNTYRFLSMLPVQSCERLLDLGSGTGVAAFVAASEYAARVWAVDITERSTQFAEFNRLLNGLRNATVLQGDLYDPVQDLSFDRIVAHPPYMPALNRKWIFQDAGSEGEQITRSIVSGLPRHLSPGGKLYCLALGADIAAVPFECRLRRWLGADENQFDCLLAVVETHKPEQIASQPLLKGEITQKEFAARRESFDKSGIERFVYGLIVLRRHQAAGRPAFTIRRQIGPRTSSAEFEWALDWESLAVSAESTARLLEAKPLLSPHLELQVIHRADQGALAPSSFTLQTNYPFDMECRIEPWTAVLLSACDGTRTGRELHQFCRERAWIPPHAPPEEFAGLMGTLVSGGFLEIEGFEPPESKEHANQPQAIPRR